MDFDSEAWDLVDHHCHGLSRAELDGAQVGALLTESDYPPPQGTSFFEGQLGFAVRRWCAPLLDLPEHAEEEEYLRRRAQWGGRRVAQTLIRAAGLSVLCVDDGFPASELLTVEELGALSGLPARRVVRLEAVAEEVAVSGVAPEDFAAAFAERLAAQCADQAVVGLKSVIGYRDGLDFQPSAPTGPEVRTAAADWLAQCAEDPSGLVSLRCPILLRHLVYGGAGYGAEHGLPLQFHTGLGDTSLHLGRVNPVHLTAFIRQVRAQGTQVVLLHCYPYHREAAYLAHAYPHVWVDVGLSLHYVGAAAARVLGETLELAPFTKTLFSTDAYGLPELYLLGSLLFRRAMGTVCDAFTASGYWSMRDAERVARMVAGGNARRLYPRLAGSA
ncbi:amidohydrolase family protein [Streptomyces sp. NPDC057798]|uniref:amidohydrolase family protein n=1 Tax=Streptomyces sp. NPDC057798 TaxID=3346252 RepID=UPI0036979B0C